MISLIVYIYQTRETSNELSPTVKLNNEIVKWKGDTNKYKPTIIEYTKN